MLGLDALLTINRHIFRSKLQLNATRLDTVQRWLAMSRYNGTGYNYGQKNSDGKSLFCMLLVVSESISQMSHGRTDEAENGAIPPNNGSKLGRT